MPWLLITIHRLPFHSMPSIQPSVTNSRSSSLFEFPSFLSFLASYNTIRPTGPHRERAGEARAVALVGDIYVKCDVAIAT